MAIKPLGFNGAKNSNIEILASAARTASINSADQLNISEQGIHLIVDVTVVPGTDTITPTIQGKDPVSGKYYDILVGSAIVATGTTVLKVFPGITAVANVAENDIIPETWRVKMVHSASGSFTYSVGANMAV